MAQETNNSLGERIRALEVMQKAAADRSAEDRAEMKVQIAALRNDIEEVTGAIKSAVDQIAGGRKVLHALYVTGTGLAIVTAWASGLLKWVAGIVVR